MSASCVIPDGVRECLVVGEDLYNDRSNSVLIGVGDCYIHLLEDNTIIVGPSFSTEVIRAALLTSFDSRAPETVPSALLVLKSAGDPPTLIHGPPMRKTHV